ncbi:MAG: peptidase M3 [Phycisphaerae bacterium]|nr:peptidase M3 [Phycisphaerae bacterium]
MSSTITIPEELDATQWSQIQPLYQELLDRKLNCSGCLETLLLDRSNLDARTSEAEADLYINMTCHTDDESCKKAYLDFVENVEPELKKVGFELDKKIAECPFAKDLDQDRYQVLLRALRTSVEMFREENIPIYTEITKLDQSYSEINGAMTVEFEGEERTMPQMARYLEETDRDVRMKAWTAIAERRLKDSERINDVFDEMIKRRHQIALNAGFDNFRDYQHQKMLRFDYTPVDCEKFHEGAEKVCMPLLRTLNKERKHELGVDVLRPWDVAVDTKGRKPLRPFDGADDLIEKTSTLFHKMDDELGTMFDSMRDGVSLDLESRKGKAPGGYQYYRPWSRKPFIFMNAAGLQRDLETMVHEAGHAFHSILCNHEPLLSYRHAPMEFCEVASMSMELLSFPYLDIFYSEADADRSQRHHLETLATMIPWIATIDAFQHWIYTNPEHSRQERTDKWVELMGRFGPDVDYTGYEDVLAMMWQRQLHLFGVPFYYIEYGIAQLGALQMWIQSKKDPADALAHYKSGLTIGGAKPLPALFEAAGLEFEFGPEMMKGLMDDVQETLKTLPA